MAAAPLYVAAAPVYVAAAPVYVAAAPPVPSYKFESLTTPQPLVGSY